MASIDLDRCPPLRRTTAERRAHRRVTLRVMETLRIGRPPRLSGRGWILRALAVDVAICAVVIVAPVALLLAAGEVFH